MTQPNPAFVRAVRLRRPAAQLFQDKMFSVRTEMGKTATAQRQLVVCVKNEGFEASLERRKIYVSIADEQAHSHKLIRVIDESGDDYLYPQKMFVPISLPQPVRRAVLTAA